MIAPLIQIQADNDVLLRMPADKIGLMRILSGGSYDYYVYLKHVSNSTYEITAGQYDSIYQLIQSLHPLVPQLVQFDTTTGLQFRHPIDWIGLYIDSSGNHRFQTAFSMSSSSYIVTEDTFEELTRKVNAYASSGLYAL
jgi:hypothetical protein